LFYQSGFIGVFIGVFIFIARLMHAVKIKIKIKIKIRIIDNYYLYCSPDACSECVTCGGKIGAFDRMINMDR